MKSFRYGADALCLAACALYALNRFVWKPQAGPGFFHDYFNDLLLIPAALPPVLWLGRRLGWRTHDGPPGLCEVAGHALLWSLICEWLGPALLHRGTADWRDVVAYAAGAGCAACWWHRPRRGEARRVAHEL